MTKTSKIRIALRAWFIFSIAVCLMEAVLGDTAAGIGSAMVCGFWWGMTEG